MRCSTVPWNPGLKRSAVGVQVPSCEASWMLTAVNVWFTQGQSKKLGSLRPRIYQARTAGGKKRAHRKYKKVYCDDGLLSSWIQYNQTVDHSYNIFLFKFYIYGVLVFLACSLGLVYLRPNS